MHVAIKRYKEAPIRFARRCARRAHSAVALATHQSLKHQKREDENLSLILFVSERNLGKAEVAVMHSKAYPYSFWSGVPVATRHVMRVNCQPAGAVYVATQHSVYQGTDTDKFLARIA
jgi:hypothetical protein